MRHVLAVLILSSTALLGCPNTPLATEAQASDAKLKAPQAEIKQVDVKEAHDLLKADPKLQLLDVRTSEEYAAGHGAGARLMPLSTLSTWAAKLDKAAGYLVICRSGTRSMMASQQLVELGFKDVTNVKGGTSAWEAAGLAMEK